MRNPTTTAPDLDPRSKDVVRMLIPEDMARIRWQELSSEAEAHRVANRLRRGRWWRRLADYATERAERGDRTD